MLLCLAGIAATADVWTVVFAGALGFLGAFVLTIGFALPALLSAPADVARMSAAMFTISYSEGLVIAVLSGAAWDLGGSPRFAFLPMAIALTPLLILPATIGSIGRAVRPRLRSPAMPNRNITPMLRTAARRIGLGLAIAAALFVAAVVATARSGDRTLWPPKPGTATTEVFVVNHGYHAGIVVPLAALADAASRHGLRALGYVATRFADFDRLEIGWGDEGFYREVPTPASLTVGLAIRALFQPGNLSVLHVVGVGADARATFATSDSCAWSSARRALRAWRTSSTPRSRAGRAGCRWSSDAGFMERACSFVPTARSICSTSATTGSPGCSMPPVFRPRPCSPPCRAACCSI